MERMGFRVREGKEEGKECEVGKEDEGLRKSRLRKGRKRGKKEENKGRTVKGQESDALCLAGAPNPSFVTSSKSQHNESPFLSHPTTLRRNGRPLSPHFTTF